MQHLMGDQSQLELSTESPLRVTEVGWGEDYCKKSPAAWGGAGATGDPASTKKAAGRKTLEQVAIRLE